MKGYLICLAVGLLFMTGCDQQTDADSVNQRLFKLAYMNGCIECHTVSVATVGPSWIAVAERYKALPRVEARNILVASVMKGSKGKWLTMKGAAGMPPLEKRVSGQDVNELVDFILSLNQTSREDS